MQPLPRLMVAPNGARRGKEAHSALPVTDDEIVETARACHAAGADGIHLHIRDAQGLHEIDVGHYQAVLDRLAKEVPQMYLQVTSESADRYSAVEQRAMMRELRPAHISVALREMVRQPNDWAEAADFYDWARISDVDVQHILYAPSEVRSFVQAIHDGRIPGKTHLIQFVQGTYANGPKDSVALADYLAELEKADGMTFDWGLCAFGAAETDSLVQAARLGGTARVGFENSLWHKDGTLAVDNAARVHEVDAALRAIGV
jgi:uncharacterized protein (DUF849 family)